MPSGSSRNLAALWLAALMIATTTYAAVRYHVFGTTPWSSFPIFTLNKAVSWTALALLVISYCVKHKPAARDAGILGFALAALHIVLSLAILNPVYFAKLYRDARLTTAGEATLLAGAVAAVLLCLPALATLPGMRSALGESRWLRWQRAGYWALALTAAHCALLGAPAWFTLSRWPGRLPPITLICFLLALLPFAWKFIARASAPDASRETR